MRSGDTTIMAMQLMVNIGSDNWTGANTLLEPMLIYCKLDALGRNLVKI